MNRLRVCFVCHEYPPGRYGGIGTVTCNLSRSLVAAGHEVRVIGSYRTDQPGPSYEEDEGVRVWRLRASPGRLRWMADRFRIYRRIADWSRRGEIDVVEVPDWQGWAAGWPRLPVPLVVRLHGSASYFAAEAGKRPSRNAFYLERLSLRRADYWSSVSRYTGEKTRDLFRLAKGPDAILYTPVEVPAAPSTHERERNSVVFTGTLTTKKGIVSLFRAWPEVVSRCRDAKLQILGRDGRTEDGESMQAFLRRQLDDQVNQSVHFTGFVPYSDVFRALETARVAVFPSYAEAFACAPLEAMIRHCPTIYSQRGSGPELISDGINGLLVDPDNASGIAQAITRVLQDDALAKSLAAAGRQRAEAFAMPKILIQNENYFRACVERFAAARANLHQPRLTEAHT